MLLSDRIAADLRHELASGKPPAAYTLQALAARFGVSLTPVREALAQVVDSGHLLRLPNGRLAAAPHPPAAAPKPPEADDAGGRVRAQIIQLSLTADAPLFLREEEAAQRFGIGRTVLRRLLFQMAGEGLLEHVPRRGWRALPLGEAELEAFVCVRELLEPQALLLAWGRLDKHFLKEVLARNRPARGKKPAQIDNRLHAHWIGLCGNRHIGDFFAKSGGAYAALFDYAALDRATASAMAAQHRAILEAILAGKRKEACRQLVIHAQAQLGNARRLRRILTERTAKAARKK